MKVPKYMKEWSEASDRFEIDCSICSHHGENLDPDDICKTAPCIANEQRYADKFDDLRDLLEIVNETN